MKIPNDKSNQSNFENPLRNRLEVSDFGFLRRTRKQIANHPPKEDKLPPASDFLCFNSGQEITPNWRIKVVGHHFLQSAKRREKEGREEEKSKTRERERTIIKEKFSMAKMVYKFIITKNITWTLALIVAKCNLPCNFLRRGH